MTPFCPVCRKRVEKFNGPSGPIGMALAELGEGDDFDCTLWICSECGVMFNPEISERIAPKCRSCGATYSEDPDWRSKISFVEIPIVAGLCGKCTDEALKKARS